HRPQAVACLGDSFHDRQAGQRIHGEDVETIRALARGRDWIWIAGNHDPEPPAGLPGRLLPELRLDGLTLRHEPVAGHAAGEVAGHLHPKAAVVVQGRRMARRCFVSDGLRAVLPAFGAYAGGLDVLDRAFRPVFPHAFHAHLLGRGAVHAVPSRRLTPIA
ncbi:MAG TPA: phosphoesterase, partial [Alphaproteobacteria bacterium]|nr:phosphoesterase [Alphaproteobacteria bacterium]